MSLKKQAARVQAAGYKNQNEDSVLAHISPEEAMRLKAQGGSGMPDPHTGLPHFNENGDGGAGGSMGGGNDGGGMGDGTGGYDGGMGSVAGMDANGYDGSVGGFAGLDSAAGGFDAGLAGLGNMGFDNAPGFNAAKDSQTANVDGGFGVNSDFNGSVNTGINSDNTSGFSLSNLLGVLGHVPGPLGFAGKMGQAATSSNPGKGFGGMMGSIAGGMLGGVVGGPAGAMAGSSLGGSLGNGLSGMGAKDSSGNPDSSGAHSAGSGSFNGGQIQTGYNKPGIAAGYNPGMQTQMANNNSPGGFGNYGGLATAFNNNSQTSSPQMQQQGDGGGDGGGVDDNHLGDSGYVSPTAGQASPTGPSTGNTVGANRDGFDFGSLTSLLPGLAGIYSSNQAQNNAQGVTNQANVSQNLANSQANTLANMYGPNSPYAAQLREQLGRKDAAAGRNSQYGPREVELQARLADAATRNAPNVMAANKEALAAAGKGYDARQYGTAAQGQTFSKLLGMAQQSGLLKSAGKGLSGLFGGMGGLSMGNPGSSGNSVGGLAELESQAANAGSGQGWPSAESAASYGSANNNPSSNGGNFWDSWL